MPEGCNAILDHYIGMNGSSLSGNDLKVILDFKLFHQFDTNEMSFLNGIVISNRLELLKHPVCESFLSMKWLRVKKFFYFYVFIYLWFLLSLNGIILLDLSPMFQGILMIIRYTVGILIITRASHQKLKHILAAYDYGSTFLIFSIFINSI